MKLENTLTMAQVDAIMVDVEAGEWIPAIKKLRYLTNIGLLDAKNCIHGLSGESRENAAVRARLMRFVVDAPSRMACLVREMQACESRMDQILAEFAALADSVSPETDEPTPDQVRVCRVGARVRYKLEYYDHEMTGVVTRHDSSDEELPWFVARDGEGCEDGDQFHDWARHDEILEVLT